MDSNSQDVQDMQEALEAYQAYKAHKANLRESDAQPRSSIVGDIAGGAKAFAAGAGQGLTLGNVGNIGGAVQALASYLGKPGQTDRDLEAQGFKIQQPSAFDVGKQATNDALDKEYNEHPWAYRAGYVGGSLPLASPTRAVYDAAGGGYAGAGAVGGVNAYLHDYDFKNPDNNLDKVAPGVALGMLLKAPTDMAVKGLGVAGDWAAKAARMTKAQAQAYLDNVLGTEKMAGQLGNVSEDPQGMVDLQNQARDAIAKSRAALKAKGLGNAAQLRTMLDGKSATINPADYEGLDPEVDSLLQQARAKIAQSTSVPSSSEAPELENFPWNKGAPEQTPQSNPYSFQDVPARQPETPPTADNLKQYFAKLAGLAHDESPAIGGSASNAPASAEDVSNFSKMAGLGDSTVDAVGREANTSISPEAVQNFKQMVNPQPESLQVDLNDLNSIKRILQQKSQFAPGTVVDPQQAARNSLLASKSQGLRSLIEREGGDDVAPLNKEMQESVLLQKALRQGAKNNPLAFVSTESPDRMATLARAETKGAGGLFDLGNQLGAAKSIAAKDVGSGIMSSPVRAAGRAGLRGVGLFKPSVEELNDFPLLQQVLQSGLFPKGGQ